MPTTPQPHPTPPKAAGRLALLGAGALVVVAVVAADSAVDVLVAAVGIAALIGLALVIDAAVDEQLRRHIDAALRPARPAAPAGNPGQDDGSGCALCRRLPAVAGDELCWRCLAALGGVPADLRAAGEQLHQLAVDELARRIRHRVELDPAGRRLDEPAPVAPILELRPRRRA